MKLFFRESKKGPNFDSMSSPGGGWRTKWIECSYQRCSSRCRCGFMRKIRMFWRCNYYSWNGNYCLVSLWRMCRYRSKIHTFYPIEVAHVNFHFQYCTDLWLHFLHLLIKNSKHLAPFNLKSEHFLAWRTNREKLIKNLKNVFLTLIITQYCNQCWNCLSIIEYTNFTSILQYRIRT